MPPPVGGGTRRTSPHLLTCMPCSELLLSVGETQRPSDLQTRVELGFPSFTKGCCCGDKRCSGAIACHASF